MRTLLSAMIIAGLSLLPQTSSALTLEEVLRSSHTHAPQIANALIKVEEKDAAIQEAQGAFDWELNGTAAQRTGIYDGNFADTQVTRRLSDSNVRLYGGYRVSDGELPIYEDIYNSSTGGEATIGVAFALLRDRIIDEERFRFRDAVIAKKQQETEAYLVKLRIQSQAMQAYATWLAQAHALEVIEELASLARERQQALSAQAGAGDIARIYLTENKQNIARREAQAADARRRLKQSAQKLSLFYRDDNGNPLVPESDAVPALIAETTESKIFDTNLDEIITSVQDLRPEQIMIDFSMKRAKNRVLLGENARLPKLDLALEAGQNMGSDAAIDAGSEGRAMLRLSVPLQQNTADGRIRAAQAQLKSLEIERRLLNDRIAADIRAAAATAIETREEIVAASEEVDASIAMRVAETKRFADGDTDFFVLNMREERVAEAKLRKINAERTWLDNLALFHFLTLNESELLPSGK